MSFRNRPVLDRKHRPRWQDELRTQQLIVAGFAVAIAMAIGIFGAAAWSDHYEAHLRPVAAVGDVTYTLDDLTDRMDAISTELQGRYEDLQSRLGGVRDSLIQQALQSIQDALSSLAPTAADTLVLGRVLSSSAGRYDISVSDEAVSAEVTKRQTVPERLKLSIITVAALPKDAASGAKPTDADWARAEKEINDIAAAIKGGADFAATAKEKSGDSSAAAGGSLSWIEADDPLYSTYFADAAKAAKGDLVGPIKGDTGYRLVRVEDKKAAGTDQRLKDLFSAAGVTDAEYRAYVRGDLLKAAFDDHFQTKVMVPYQPQREVAQIFIAAQQGIPVPQQRVRHFLAQPLPGEADQSKATDAQWAAALARAEAFRVEASKPDADWYLIAKESDDTSSGSRGGDVGWYDPGSSSFVPEFKAAIAKLKVGELSEPVKTQFGYHIIEVVAERITAAVQADEMVTTLRAHPDQFAQIARDESEDADSAAKGGDLGWVIPYQFEKERTDAIFKLSKPGEISDPITTPSGIYIFKLLATAELRWVPTQQLTSVRQSGFDLWLSEIRDRAVTWTDPQFVAAPTSG
ncbi:MAG: peptidylprolyl isomerase [Chloroflexi bacterium]|nr:peptidylprolyl isomerase [Chloroflexota bacterium]